ncbi:hypothetical protein [Actinomadura flavalba]|uniref:hypothetical protein n=1 Tax=Actinomadura flavalba TaxID=1120938 RepID=UPI0003762800|nr:hypothetical protein [Actinomadura flavalba]
MARYRSILAPAIVLAGCAALASAASPPAGSPVLDAETTRQLTAAAGTLLEQRSAALVRQSRRDRRPPAQVLGVRISPEVARGQERAVRALENRGRAPVEGGPAYTAAKTRLERARAVREGGLIVLEAVENTEMRFGEGRLVQSVRRRFEFTTTRERIVLVREGLLDPGDRPLNDPPNPSR